MREIAEIKMKDLNANDIEAADAHDRGRGPQHGRGRSGLSTRMPKHGKKYRAAAEKVDPLKQYTPDEGVKLVKDIAVRQVRRVRRAAHPHRARPQHADQLVRGSAVLPAGTGRTQRVVAFAQGDKAREAEAAGADIVGAEDLVQRIQGGWTDFDVAVATPDMMGMVGRLGRVLGPRGLMPNPRSGTVTLDIGRAIREIKGGRVEFRVDKTGVIHAPIGKVSFDEDKLAAEPRRAGRRRGARQAERRQGPVHPDVEHRLDDGSSRRASTADHPGTGQHRIVNFLSSINST